MVPSRMSPPPVAPPTITWSTIAVCLVTISSRSHVDYRATNSSRSHAKSPFQSRTLHQGLLRPASFS